METNKYQTIIDIKDNCVILGKEDDEKYSIIETMILSMAEKYKEDELIINVVDVLGYYLTNLINSNGDTIVPHNINMILADSLDNFNKVLDSLISSIQERKKLFEEKQASNLEEYNEKSQDNKLPTVVTFLNNIGSEEYSIKLEEMLSESKEFGFYFVISDKSSINCYTELYLQHCNIKVVINEYKDEFDKHLDYIIHKELGELVIDDCSYAVIYYIPYIECDRLNGLSNSIRKCDIF